MSADLRMCLECDKIANKRIYKRLSEKIEKYSAENKEHKLRVLLYCMYIAEKKKLSFFKKNMLYNMAIYAKPTKNELLAKIYSDAVMIDTMPFKEGYMELKSLNTDEAKELIIASVLYFKR